jgi:predicted nuclease of restriction endonuclease-like (RecB) superfamily
MRVEDPDARQYYITEAADHNWSTRQLEHRQSNVQLATL